MIRATYPHPDPAAALAFAEDAAARAPGPDDRDPERLDRLRLARTPGIGPISFQRLLARYGSATAVIAALPGLAAKAGRALRPPSRAEAADELARMRRLGAEPFLFGDAGYPERLAQIADPPPVIAVAGDPALLSARSVAIVGARNASAAGRRMAEQLARDLGEAGIVVVSGLARGIDAAAHQGALAGGTVAVVAGGLDIPYPPEHAPMQAEIAARGAVVAEMPPGTEPQARLFVRRNRVIAGLVLGVIVVEAAKRSGSLLTARLALEEGREVFAVPGSPLDPRAEGPNGLIKQGAHLVERADDVLAALPAAEAPLRPRPRATVAAPLLEALAAPAEASHATPPAPSEAAALVLGLLGPAPVTVDELVRRCHLTAAQVTAVLLDLELDGRIERHPGGRVSIA